MNKPQPLEIWASKNTVAKVRHLDGDKVCVGLTHVSSGIEIGTVMTIEKFTSLFTKHVNADGTLVE